MRMDMYKLGFILSQILALSFLTICVIMRNKVLQSRFLSHLKLRLLQINLNGKEVIKEDFTIKVPPEEQTTFGMSKLIEDLGQDRESNIKSLKASLEAKEKEIIVDTNTESQLI